MRRQLTKSILILVALAALSCLNLAAQTIFGSLTGDTLDSTGGAIANATVTIRELNTGIERSITTDASGFWRVPSLAIGQYSVSATAAGFDKVVQSPVDVDAATERKIEFALAPSTQATVINITAQSPLIEATKSQLSGDENAKTILELPTGGNTDILAKLMPGVCAE